MSERKQCPFCNAKTVRVYLMQSCDTCGSDFADKEIVSANKIIEQQAKEPSEAQARVVLALDQLKLDLMLENERMPTMTKRALDKFEQALASTDTAAKEKP